MSDLSIHVNDLELTANWTDDAPTTRDAIADALPFSGNANRWGDELYMQIPVDVPPENARATVSVGTVAYWPHGNALCVFWGPTPASDGPEPRAASPVNVVASIGDVDPLESVVGDATISIVAVE